MEKPGKSKVQDEKNKDSHITLDCVHPIRPSTVANYLVDNEIASVARSNKVYEDPGDYELLTHCLAYDELMSIPDCTTSFTIPEQEIIAKYYININLTNEDIYPKLNTNNLLEAQLKKLLVFITNDLDVIKYNLREVKFKICRNRTVLDHFVSGVLSFVDEPNSVKNLFQYHQSLINSDDKRIKPILEFELYKSNINILLEFSNDINSITDEIPLAPSEVHKDTGEDTPSKLSTRAKPSTGSAEKNGHSGMDCPDDLLDLHTTYLIGDMIKPDILNQWIMTEFQVNPSLYNEYSDKSRVEKCMLIEQYIVVPKILRMLVTRRESINIDRMFPDLYKEILELVAKKALIHLATETSSLHEFLPDLKRCITKLERTVEETKTILEGTGRLKPQILEAPPIIDIDDPSSSFSAPLQASSRTSSGTERTFGGTRPGMLRGCVPSPVTSFSPVSRW